MAQPPQRYDVDSLSIAERIILVEEIWDTIVAEQESFEVTKAQKEELDRRLENYRTSPDLGASWEEIKTKLQEE